MAITPGFSSLRSRPFISLCSGDRNARFSFTARICSLRSNKGVGRPSAISSEKIITTSGAMTAVCSLNGCAKFFASFETCGLKEAVRKCGWKAAKVSGGQELKSRTALANLHRRLRNASIHYPLRLSWSGAGNRASHGIGNSFVSETQSWRYLEKVISRVNRALRSLPAVAGAMPFFSGTYFPSEFRNSAFADSTSRGAAWQSKSARNRSP